MKRAGMPTDPAILERLLATGFNKMPVKALRHFSLAKIKRLAPIVLTYRRYEYVAVVLSYTDFVDLMSLLKIEVVQ